MSRNAEGCSLASSEVGDGSPATNSYRKNRPSDGCVTTWWIASVKEEGGVLGFCILEQEHVLLVDIPRLAFDSSCRSAMPCLFGTNDIPPNPM